MYKANAKRTPKTPQSPNGVQFFSQFARSWIRPYGLADTKPPTAAKVLELKPFTCEWLLRPKVALSELAESVEKNLHRALLHYCKILFLGRSSTGEATRENVVETLKFLFADNEGLDEQMDTLFSLGGAIFTMASQTPVYCRKEFYSESKCLCQSCPSNGWKWRRISKGWRHKVDARLYCE